MLLKDIRTGKKSITVTMLLLTMGLTMISVVINLILLWQGKTTSPELIWACMGVSSPFVAVYWQKRIRASKDGISIEADRIGGDHGRDSN